MGRTFENRRIAMQKRGLRDSRAFTRAGRAIAMAVKGGGPDADANPALRRAVQNARSVNMPKDKIKAAIDKAAGNTDADDFQEVIYEGFGPHGVAILVVTATDNTTRTYPNVRTAFKKGGGNLGNSGAVSFLFDQLGAFVLKAEGLDSDELELELIDHGLEELLESETSDGDPAFVVRCAYDAFGTMQSALEARKIEPVSSGIEWVPKTPAELTEDQVADVRALVEKIEDDDDVQEVFTTVSGL
jgi:YebC/PmpR family DNA-binding regulatory protein